MARDIPGRIWQLHLQDDQIKKKTNSVRWLPQTRLCVLNHTSSTLRAKWRLVRNSELQQRVWTLPKLNLSICWLNSCSSFAALCLVSFLGALPTDFDRVVDRFLLRHTFLGLHHFLCDRNKHLDSVLKTRHELVTPVLEQAKFHFETVRSTGRDLWLETTKRKHSSSQNINTETLQPKFGTATSKAKVHQSVAWFNYFSSNTSHCIRSQKCWSHQCAMIGLTSSTLIFSLALVSYNWIPICSANLCASCVKTTFLSGSSSLFPTASHIQNSVGNCRWTKKWSSISISPSFVRRSHCSMVFGFCVKAKFRSSCQSASWTMLGLAWAWYMSRFTNWKPQRNISF